MTHWDYNDQRDTVAYPFGYETTQSLKLHKVSRLYVAFNHKIIVFGLGDRLHSVTAFYTQLCNPEMLFGVVD